METISILTPTRRRPANILRMLTSIKDTMSGENKIEVIYRADASDELLNNDEFISLTKKFISDMLSVTFVFGKETFPDLGILWNEAYKESTGDILQLGGDDLIYKSKNWDTKVVRLFTEYPDKIVLVWGQDDQHNQSLASHGFVSRRWVETVGWFVPPYGFTYCNDCYIHDIAGAISRHHYVCDIHIQHLWRGNDPNEENYGRMLKNFQKDADIFYGERGREIINEAADKLRKVLNT